MRVVKLLEITAEKNVQLTDEYISSLYDSLLQHRLENQSREGLDLVTLFQALGDSEEFKAEIIYIKRLRVLLDKFLANKDARIRQLEEQVRKSANGEEKSQIVLMERLNTNIIEMSQLEEDFETTQSL